MVKYKITFNDDIELDDDVLLEDVIDEYLLMTECSLTNETLIQYLISKLVAIRLNS